MTDYSNSTRVQQLVKELGAGSIFTARELHSRISDVPLDNVSAALSLMRTKGLLEHIETRKLETSGQEFVYRVSSSITDYEIKVRSKLKNGITRNRNEGSTRTLSKAPSSRPPKLIIDEIMSRLAELEALSQAPLSRISSIELMNEVTRRMEQEGKK